MCGICNVVNCIKRSLCGCGRNRGCGSNNYYRYNGCSNDCDYGYNSCGRQEPRTRITCANRSENCYTPCREDNDCSCHKHHHDCDN